MRRERLYGFNVDQILSNFLSLSDSLKGKIVHMFNNPHTHNIICNLTLTIRYTDLCRPDLSPACSKCAIDLIIEKVNVDGGTCATL